MRIVPASIVREAEQGLFRSGAVTSAELMHLVVLEMHSRLTPEWLACQELGAGHVVLYLGKGNNAGDAAGLARMLGRPICVRAACAVEGLAPETRAYLADAQAHNTPVSFLAAEDMEGLLSRPGGQLIIDGLLGSGAKGALRPAYAELVEEMNALRAARPDSRLLAIDIPTGLDPDSGTVSSVAVKADVTATIGCTKPGMLVDGAEDHVGRLLYIPLPKVQLPETEYAAAGPQGAGTPLPLERVLDAGEIRGWLTRREFSCFKNKAGRVNIVAGSIGYLGAAQLCAEAAMAAGAGLVALYCLPETYPLLATRVAPEIMVRPVASYAEVPTGGAQCLLVGPGLGTPAPAEVEALHQLISRFPGPVVLDADALNLAAAHGWGIPPNAILTPHPGEMRRLFPASTGLSRRETALRFVREHPCTLMLKGARTIITNGSTLFYNSTGGPFMANGGQGDTLAGVTAALAAQGLPALRAAALAAFHCGLAAQRAASPIATASGVGRELRVF